MASAKTAAGHTAFVACAVLLPAAVVAYTLHEAPPGTRAAAATVNGLVAGVPLAVALAVLRREPRHRFGRMLLAAGAAFALTALAQSRASVPYSIGRLSVWGIVPLLLLLMLTFPSGRLSRRRDRRLTAAAIGIAITLYLPTALLEGGFPTPSPWTSCGERCPRNAFAVSDAPLGFVRPLREVLLVALVATVAAALGGRLRVAGPLQRRVLAPVVAIAVFQVVAFAAYQWARRGGAVSSDVVALGRVYLLSLPAVAVAFASGLLLRRLHVGVVLQRLTLDLRAPATPAALRTRLAEALEDPTLRVAYWHPGTPGHWVDEGGAPATVTSSPPERVVTEVAAHGERVAAVVHDGRLGQDPTLIEAAASYGLVVLENTRLIEDLRASDGRLVQAESRAAAIAEHERRKLERDLHDGAQQQLLALRIRLALAAEALRADVPDRAQELEVLGDGIDEAVDVMRTLAHGSPPTSLGQRGLAPALRLVALDATLPAVVRARGIGRYDDAIEAAVYFCCIEALHNAVKHAHGATGVTILLVDDGALRFEVADDGPGFEGNGRLGGGLRNLADRMDGVGGTLAIASEPGSGTRVAGVIPLTAGRQAPPRPTGAQACGTPAAER